jgi:hypothetical protein
VSTLINSRILLLKIRILWVRIFCFCALIQPLINAQAQTIQLKETLGQLLQKRPAPSFKWDTQNSFITGQSVKVQSLKGGVSFGEHLTLGIGYHWLQSEITQAVKGYAEPLPLKMRYGSLFGEFVFYDKGNWIGVLPIQVGYGKSFLLAQDPQGNAIKLYHASVLLYEPSISIEYKFSPWIGVGAGYGYRIMLKNNPDLNQNFYAPLYVFRVRILFEELYSKYGHMLEDEIN